ncbi:MAG TPA: hypothetical protein DEG76_16615 [Pseudohongiella sp.]|nr:hypothetical protein [Pseudohongiella sp.]HBX38804.1 hypothetical protein [Pseudohongiella sp.]|tara:strand:+ start:2671 stop:3033 length:363 start_codon:yes stop_codon:yes gene_type:complete
MRLSWFYVVLAVWSAVFFFFAQSFFAPLLDVELRPSNEALSAGGFIVTVGFLWASIKPSGSGPLHVRIAVRMVFFVTYMTYEMVIGQARFGATDWLFLSLCCLITIVPLLLESRRALRSR